MNILSSLDKIFGVKHEPVDIKDIAPIVMVDKDARPTNKPELCYMWTRLQKGFGWHYPSERPIPKV